MKSTITARTKKFLIIASLTVFTLGAFADAQSRINVYKSNIVVLL